MTNCTVTDCENKQKSKGYCGMHYKRSWRHGDPLIVYIELTYNHSSTCLIDGCDNKYKAKGYCAVHYHTINKGRYSPRSINWASWITPEYRAWANMKSRCYNIRTEQYKNWGGRGITVCDEWRAKDGFKAFHLYIGDRPEKGYSLDRIDNNGNYEPGNIRWATAKEQSNNQRPRKKTTITT